MPKNWRSPTIVLLCGGLILSIALGVRHGFGLFLQPMSLAHGWGREAFAFALAMQNLFWGATQPLVGMIADRYGAGKVLVCGALLYVLGLIGMAYTNSAGGLTLSAGLLIGLGLSGTTFSIVYGVLGRICPPQKRSMTLGIAGAAGSFGQFALLPLSQSLISGIGWFSALLVLALLATLIAPLAAALVEPPRDKDHQLTLTVRQAIAEAWTHRGFMLLNLGYFVCGFQVVFIGVHLPAYLADQGLSAEVGVNCLALIGLFNIFGTFAAGWLGQHFSKKHLLAAIYLLRSLVILSFLLTTLSPLSAYLFAMSIGLLWLATVPLTTGIVAQVFGVSYFAMLGGFVFFSHQLGSFFGVWLGGLLYDYNGSYDTVWVITILLGVAAMLLHIRVDQRPLQRLAPA